MTIWEEIKEKLDIVDVISDYVKLKPSGTNQSGLCPFHSEKSPSFMVSPSKQIFHCFGCGLGGDIFSFVSEIENISNGETLKRLAERTGTQLTSYTEEEKQEIIVKENNLELGYKMLNWGAEIYNKVLLKVLEDPEHPISKYVAERGLNKEIIDLFKIGYAPSKSWLLQNINKLGIDKNVMLAVGLLNGDKDKFSDRLMIPIRQHQGKVAGFTGRVLPYDNSNRPKYLNTSQSDWFNKSDILFGLDTSRKTIIKEKQVIIVEGNMDVIACYLHGITNCVASQGTAVTENQIKLLKRHTDNLIIAFDNDTAGQIASNKLFCLASKYGFNIKKLIIPKEYKDIDEMLQHTKEYQVVPYLDYALANMQEYSNLEEKRKAITDILTLVSASDNLSREHYVDLVAKKTDTNIKTITSMLNTRTEPIKETPKEISEAQQIMNTFKRITNDYGAELQFVLLQSILEGFKEYNSLEDYKTKNSSEIQFIQEFAIDHQKCNMVINMYIDKNINQILLSPELIEIYLKLKVLTSQQ